MPRARLHRASGACAPRQTAGALVSARRCETGARRAAQAASAAHGPDRGAWLALAARHQLPRLAAHLGTLIGAAAARADDGSNGAAGGGNGCTAALLASLGSPAHTELTRCEAPRHGAAGEAQLP